MAAAEGLRTKLQGLQKEALRAVAAAESMAALEQLRVRFLGKRGELTQMLKGIGRLPAEARPQMGEAVNRLKSELTAALSEAAERLKRQEEERRIRSEHIDVTLPGRRRPRGAVHPVTKGLNEMVRIFAYMGFEIAEGPEIEDEFHNFDALNIPPEHPARAMHDTFFFPDGRLLRTHTSPVQIRAMRRLRETGGVPPWAVVAPGRVFRCDSDMTHSPMFHQIEVFRVDRDVSMAHLKGVIAHFLSAYFEKEVPIRLRPHYFPFTEPSAEVDIGCVFCDGRGCRVCKGSGWLEVLGAGMIHPNVLQAVEVDRNHYTGFAFGLGVERLVMLKHGIPDLRLFFENDVRFIRRMGT